eukprot:1130772-Rhodomonas_salina.1
MHARTQAEPTAPTPALAPPSIPAPAPEMQRRKAVPATARKEEEREQEKEKEKEEEWEGIPIVPVGRVLELKILSTWYALTSYAAAMSLLRHARGDAHYVGLSGIDLFGSDGSLIQVPDYASNISADPPDINVLAGYSGDPRTVDNLLDGL